MFGNSKEKQLTEYIDQVLADDILSDEEQVKLFAFARSLGISFNEFMNQRPGIQERVVIALINAGRLPGAMPPYHLLVKPGEEVLLEAPASMLKEVADRAWHGGFSGFSFPIAFGVRYRVGQTQGHMQQVGTKMIESDAGWLSVTSARIVFSGKTSTREIHYDKLVNLTVFAIGVTECIAVAVSKGQEVDTQTYAMSKPHLFAAVITAAAQPHLAGPSAAPPHLTETSAAFPVPPSNVGVLSEDGAWRWDGHAWQPVGFPPPPLG